MLEPRTVVAPASAYFFSDAHLGAMRGAPVLLQEQKLAELLEKARRDARTLFIVGDLFDFWFEWKHVIPKRYFPFLFKLHQLIADGIEIHYLAGNHDFRLHGFLEQSVGMRVHHEAITALVNGQRLFVYHGDGILKRDSGYRLLKRVLRNKAAQKVYEWIHPDLGMSLARGTSITSRTVIKENPNDDRDYLAFAQAKLAHGYDGVIMGHTHRPVEFREQNRTYINLGDWMKHFTYAIHDGQQLTLHRL